MGGTGQGKTTILEAICGLRPVTSGRVLLGGDDVTRRKPADRGVGYVPQDLALFPTMTVRGHLEFALRIRRTAAGVDRRARRRTGRRAGDRTAARPPRAAPQRRRGTARRPRPGAFVSAARSAARRTAQRPGRSDPRPTLRTAAVRFRSRAALTTLHVTHSRTEARLLADQVDRAVGRPTDRAAAGGSGSHAGGAREAPRSPSVERRSTVAEPQRMKLRVQYTAQLRTAVGRPRTRSNCRRQQPGRAARPPGAANLDEAAATSLARTRRRTRGRAC